MTGRPGQRSVRGAGLAALSVVLAAGWVGAGCARDSSILLVEVAGDVTLPLAQFEVTVSAGMRVKSFLVPSQATPFNLPVSFSVELDPDVTGPVSVYVAAFDESGGFVGDAETWQSHIVAGGQTIVAVMLNTAAPPVAGKEDGR